MHLVSGGVAGHGGAPGRDQRRIGLRGAQLRLGQAQQALPVQRGVLRSHGRSFGLLGHGQCPLVVAAPHQHQSLAAQGPHLQRRPGRR